MNELEFLNHYECFKTVSINDRNDIVDVFYQYKKLYFSQNSINPANRIFRPYHAANK